MFESCRIFKFEQTCFCLYQNWMFIMIHVISGILTFQNEKQWSQTKAPVCINSLQHTSIHGSLPLNKIKCSKVCEWKFSSIPPVPVGAGCSQLSAWAWGGNLFQRLFESAYTLFENLLEGSLLRAILPFEAILFLVFLTF